MLKKITLASLIIGLLAGCASTSNLPVKTATVTRANPTLKQVYTPNALGAVGGATAGGLLGNQIGKGHGKTAATIAGVLLGGTLGSTVGATTTTVPATLVTLMDDETGQVLVEQARLDGNWSVGMKVRYSVSDAKLIIR